MRVARLMGDPHYQRFDLAWNLQRSRTMGPQRLRPLDTEKGCADLAWGLLCNSGRWAGLYYGLLAQSGHGTRTNTCAMGC